MEKKHIALLLITITFFSCKNMKDPKHEQDDVSYTRSGGEEHYTAADGSFNYRVTIEFRYRVGAVFPELTLAYNSHRGNGMLGMGWQLEGLPLITRDTAYPINYDGTDHYIGPNGGRLVKIEGEENIYHYMEETFSVFEMSGGFNDDPDEPLEWIETRPNGTKYYYGTVENSRAAAVDSGNAVKGVRAWALYRVEDIQGNYYTITYKHDQGQVYPERIVYAPLPIGKNTLPDFQAIEFTYDDSRPDVQLSYRYHTPVKTGLRLSGIVIKNNLGDNPDDVLAGETVLSYAIGYADAAASHKSLVNSIKAADSTGEVKYAGGFDWFGNNKNRSNSITNRDRPAYRDKPLTFFGLLAFFLIFFHTLGFVLHVLVVNTNKRRRKMKKLSSCLSTVLVLPMLMACLFAGVVYAADNHSTGPDGSFNYRVDIDVPPGTKGVEPRLALVYNSNARNGMLGVGWQLEGLPVITRDARYGIHYDSNDEYTAAGVHLVKVGDYYHYETEAFSRFEARDSQGDGPAYWIETKADGTKYYYGYEGNSQVQASDREYEGEPCVHTWALSRVEDVHGNYYTIKYILDNGNYYPEKIVYTQGNGISTYRKVEFEYSDERTDKEVSFALGTQVATNKRLASVKTFVDVSDYLLFETGELVKSYNINFKESVNDKISIISNIYDTNNNDENLLIETSWSETNESFEPFQRWVIKTGDYSEWGKHLADVNGDGKVDLIAWCMNGNGTWAQVALSNGDGFEPFQRWVIKTGDYSEWGKHLADVNGDGKVDLIAWCMNGNGTWADVALSNGDGFEPFQRWITKTGDYSAWGKHLADVNGDGKVDLIAWCMNGNGTWADVALSNGDDFRIQSIKNRIGKKISVDYTPAPQHPNAINPTNSTYPTISNKSPRYLASKVTVSDGRGNEYSTSYQYEDGKVYMGKPWERQDLGFAIITETDDNTGQKTVTTCRQDKKELHHRPEKIEVYAGNGEKTKQVDFTYYEESGDFTTVFNTTFVKQKSIKTSIFEDNNLVSETTQNFNGYDDYGNVLEVTETTDPVTETITDTNSFAIDTTNWIVNRPAEVKKSAGTELISWESYTYTANNLVAKRVYLDTQDRWITTGFGHNACGNVTAITDARGNTTTIGYDSDYQSYPVTVTNALGHATVSTYDPRFGLVLTKTDANGNTTTNEYDDFGRLTKVIEPGDEWTKQYVYNDSGDAATQYIEEQLKEADGYSYTRKYFDALKRTYKIEKKGYQGGSHNIVMVTDLVYNNYGKLASRTEPYAMDNGVLVETDGIVKTTYDYDTQGRLIKVTDTNDKTKTIDYYTVQSGIITTHITNIDGSVVKEEYNTKNQLVRNIDVGNQTLVYSYTASGKLKTIMDPDGLITTVTYDSLGRKTTIDDPNTGVTAFTYTDVNKLASQTDANGQTITYAYDALNRLASIDYPAGTLDVSYTYDNTAYANSIGRITGIDDGVSTTELSYSPKGQVAVKKQTIDTNTYIFKMEYDAQKRLAELTYPDGVSITREYSHAGFLNAVKWGDSAIVRYGRFETDENGNITDFSNTVRRSTGNDVHTKIAYDSKLQAPLSVVTKHLKDNVLTTHEDIQYEYDTGNRIKQINVLVDGVSGTHSQTFTYDSFNRLKTAHGIYGDIVYEYLNNGNLKQKSGVYLGYGDSAHPYAATTDGLGNTYTYDANGNMTGRKGKTLAYDAKNRLVSISNMGTLETSYAYNHAGNRIKKEKADGTITYNLDGLYEVNMVPGYEANHTKYFYGIEGELVAQATAPASETSMITASTPLIIAGLYTTGTIKGLLMSAWQYLNHGVKSMRVYKNIMQTVLLLTFIGVIVLLVVSARSTDKRAAGAPLLVRSFSSLLLFVMISVVGMSGCELPFISGDTHPWDSLDYQENITTENMPTTGMYFFHPDYTGNISYVTDRFGAKVHQLYYKPYGEVAEKSGDDVHRFKFNTQESDDESGLQYYKARYYDPLIGRFITPDSVVPSIKRSQSLNRYAYVEGSPIEYADFNGHWSVKGFFKKVGKAVNKIGGAVGSLAGLSGGGSGSSWFDSFTSFFKDAVSGLKNAVSFVKDSIAKIGNTAKSLFGETFEYLKVYSGYNAYVEGGWRGLLAYGVSVALTAVLVYCGIPAIVDISYTYDNGWSAGVGAIAPNGITVSISYSSENGFSVEGGYYGQEVVAYNSGGDNKGLSLLGNKLSGISDLFYNENIAAMNNETMDVSLRSSGTSANSNTTFGQHEMSLVTAY